MTPSEIRKELLAQHANLAKLADEARAVTIGAAGDGTLSRHLRELADAVEAHIRHEEQLLRDLMPRMDAWGDARVALMDDHHADQHGHIQSVLRAVAIAEPSADTKRRVLLALDELAEHMKREEAEILHPHVLRDDVVTVGQSGG